MIFSLDDKDSLVCVLCLCFMFVFFVCVLCSKQNQPELEGEEGDAGALVELGLELHPVKPEGVQERRQTLHQYWGGFRFVPSHL